MDIIKRIVHTAYALFAQECSGEIPQLRVINQDTGDKRVACYHIDYDCIFVFRTKALQSYIDEHGPQVTTDRLYRLLKHEDRHRQQWKLMARRYGKTAARRIWNSAYANVGYAECPLEVDARAIETGIDNGLKHCINLTIDASGYSIMKMVE